jgi:hypothetical protein
VIVIVHGYDGSGPDHWQRWLHDELRRRNVPAAFPDLPAPSAPKRDEWVATLEGVVAGSREPVTFVCHSLGCWAVDHLLARSDALPVRAALLVAPPSPFLLFEPVESFLPPPRRRESWASIAARSLVVGSDNDEYAGEEEITAVARDLGAPCRILPGAGHINVASGYGPWPFALEWLHGVGAC